MRFLSIVLLAIFLSISLAGGVEGNRVLYETYGLSLNGIAQDKLWQLVSYASLHGSWLHVLLNVLVLYVLGLRLQSSVGVKKALLVVLSGVLAGGVLHVLVNCCVERSEQTLLVGVSGGVMAVLLSLTTLFPYSVMRPLRIRAKHFGSGFLMSSAMLLLLMPSLGIPWLSGIGEQVAHFFGTGIFQVSHACHLGGGLAGVLSTKFFLKGASGN